MCGKGARNGIKYWKKIYLWLCFSDLSHTVLMSLHTLKNERLYTISFKSYGHFLRKSKKCKMAVFGHFWTNFGYVYLIPVIRFGLH